VAGICVICGGANDAQTSWQTYCQSCSKETWGPAVVAKFIETIADYDERLSRSHAMLNELQDTIDRLEGRK
jgi:hypothetical protein